MLYTILLVLFVLDAALLMVVILLQDSKGQGLAGAFGGGGGGATSFFGARGASTFLSKATTYLGTAFLVLCIIMSMMRPSGAGEQRSIMMESAGQTEEQAPSTGLPLLPGASPTVPQGARPDTGGAGD